MLEVAAFWRWAKGFACSCSVSQHTPSVQQSEKPDLDFLLCRVLWWERKYIQTLKHFYPAAVLFLQLNKMTLSVFAGRGQSWVDSVGIQGNLHSSFSICIRSLPDFQGQGILLEYSRCILHWILPTLNTLLAALMVQSLCRWVTGSSFPAHQHHWLCVLMKWGRFGFRTLTTEQCRVL